MFKNRKMMRISLLLVGLLLVAGSSAFVAQRVLAGSCFTDVADGSFWYNVTCWMKAKGISTGYADGTYRPDNNVTRGEMSLFIQRAFSNTSMVDYLTTGPTQWVANDAYPSAYVEPYWGWTHLHSSALGTVMFNLSPTLPTSLYNTLMYAKGVRLCFDADPNAYVTAITVKHLFYTASGFSEINSIADPTDRSGVGCVNVNFAAARETYGSDQVTILLEVTFLNTGYAMLMGTSTVIMYPSTYYSALGIDELGTDFVRDVIAPAEDDPTSGLVP